VEVQRLEDEEHAPIRRQRRTEHQAHRPILVLDHDLHLKQRARGEAQRDDGGTRVQTESGARVEGEREEQRRGRAGHWSNAYCRTLPVIGTKRTASTFFSS
jgi:hypothetical protein